MPWVSFLMLRRIMRKSVIFGSTPERSFSFKFKITTSIKRSIVCLPERWVSRECRDLECDKRRHDLRFRAMFGVDNVWKHPDAARRIFWEYWESYAQKHLRCRCWWIIHKSLDKQAKKVARPMNIPDVFVSIKHIWGALFVWHSWRCWGRRRRSRRWSLALHFPSAMFCPSDFRR